MAREAQSTSTADIGVRWSPRVSKRLIRRLYASEAAGVLDEDLVNEVGIMLYLRCRSILAVGRAQRGLVDCPRCADAGRETVIERRKGDPGESLCCSVCGWCATWGAYRKTFQRKQLSEGGVDEYFSAFLRRYAAARTAREKMLAIDRVLHEFHYNTVNGLRRPTRAACVNLIQGRLTDVVAFLSELSGTAPTSPEVQCTSDEWRSTVRSIPWHPTAG